MANCSRRWWKTLWIRCLAKMRTEQVLPTRPSRPTSSVRRPSVTQSNQSASMRVHWKKIGQQWYHIVFFVVERWTRPFKKYLSAFLQSAFRLQRASLKSYDGTQCIKYDVQYFGAILSDGRLSSICVSVQYFRTIKGQFFFCLSKIVIFWYVNLTLLRIYLIFAAKSLRGCFIIPLKQMCWFCHVLILNCIPICHWDACYLINMLWNFKSRPWIDPKIDCVSQLLSLLAVPGDSHMICGGGNAWGRSHSCWGCFNRD